MKKKKLLFDTHTFLWLDSNPEKWSPVDLAACEDSDNELYLSVDQCLGNHDKNQNTSTSTTSAY